MTDNVIFRSNPLGGEVDLMRFDDDFEIIVSDLNAQGDDHSEFLDDPERYYNDV